MKSHRRHLIAAGLIAAAGFGTAFAQTPPGPAGGPGHEPARMEQMHAKRQERMAKHLANLKQKLAITPAQEAAWSAWTASLQPTQHQRPNRAEFQNLTTPERIDRMRSLRAERNAEMDRRMDATKTFYAALNPDQKKVFDAESARMMGGHRGGRHGEHQHG
jgi:hypothetical protein